MIDSLMDKLRRLPEAEQRAWLRHWTEELELSREVHVLSDEERALVREGLAELDRGEYASDEDVRKVFDRHRA